MNAPLVKLANAGKRQRAAAPATASSASGAQSNPGTAGRGEAPLHASPAGLAAAPLDCKPTVTRVHGVAPDAAGYQRLRIVAFRGHCETCGWLGEKRESFFNARGDVAAHRAGRTVKPRGGLEGAAARHRSSDAVCADHLPACPKCSDLSDEGATVCESCGARLAPRPERKTGAA